MNTELPLRPNVCMLVVNNDRKLFLGERFGRPGVWQFPQGGIEEGQTPEQAVIRELEEELGVRSDLVSIVTKLQATHQYRYNVTPPFSVGRWAGQSQTFWIVRFVGNDSDIQLDRHEQEFQSFRWCTIKEVEKSAEPIRLPGYKKPLQELRALELVQD